MEISSLAAVELGKPVLADLYLPDTHDGRREAYRLQLESHTSIGFCRDYRPFQLSLGGEDPRLCDRRDCRYMDGFNKCRRCPAGFMFEALRGDLPDAEISPVIRESINRNLADLKDIEMALEESSRQGWERTVF